MSMAPRKDKRKGKDKHKSQVEKQRPYRVDYFDYAEMKGEKVFVHSVIVRATTSTEASQLTNCTEGRTILRAYRYYKKLGKNRDRKKPIALTKLVSKKRAKEIRAEIAAHGSKSCTCDYPKTMSETCPTHGLDQAQAPVPPDVLLDVYTQQPDVPPPMEEPVVPPPTSGPDSPATKAVVEDLNNMTAGDHHEQMMDKFVPDSNQPPIYPPLPDVSFAKRDEEGFEHFPQWLIWVGGVILLFLLIYMANC
jgi:hypothetical protein